LYLATDGVVANVMNLLREAMLLALKREAPQITLLILAHSYDHRLKAHLQNRPNPFVVPPTESLSSKPK
jgi:hypothetical protein